MGKSSELCFVFAVLSLFCFSLSFGQLPWSQTYSLFRVSQQLEFPPVTKSWNRHTNFCSLPPTLSLAIVCTQDRVTELTIVGGNRPPSSRKSFAVSSFTLSSNFSIDSLFATLSKISSLEVLSLVSLGIWGGLPSKVTRLSSLRVLNLSSNSVYGRLPGKISSLPNLQTLVLHDNLLNGSVPDLSGMKTLQELDLANNLLGPKFPALPNKLVTVNLHANKFSSNVPLSLASFDQIQRLDLSTNQLMGSVPSALLSLPSIQYLNMAGNELSGSLPKTATCNKELRYVDLSDNLLTGSLPACISTNSSNKVVLYSGNCLSYVNSANQHPFSFCNKEGPFAANPNNTKKRTSKSNLGLVIGIGAAVVGGLLIMGILLWLIFRKLGGKNADDHLVNTSLMENAPSLTSPKILLPDSRNANGGMRLGALGLPPYYVFTLEEIEEVTSNFEEFNLIEDGPRGKLYKGWSRDGSQVAVRCIELKQNYSQQSMQHYAEAISKLRHRNLVSILGHYIDNKTIYLVMENVSNGTLRSHLTDPKYEMLRWPQRVAAAIGVAKGIQFLHRDVSPGIFGNDIKIDNVRLDDNLTVKISVYNLPLPSKHKATMVGSESPLGGGPNDLVSIEEGQKADIHQLGVILLELISGNPITSDNELKALKHKMEKSLTDAPKKLRAATDPSLRGTYAYDSVRTVAEIALNCLSEDIGKRPSVEDVLWNLQYSVQVQDGWANSGHLSGSFSNLSDALNN